MTSSGIDLPAPSEPGPTVPRDLQIMATVRGSSLAKDCEKNLHLPCG
jgi:hypothetical protein